MVAMVMQGRAVASAWMQTGMTPGEVWEKGVAEGKEETDKVVMVMVTGLDVAEVETIEIDLINLPPRIRAAANKIWVSLVRLVVICLSSTFQTIGLTMT
jgi:hypothetical protein